MRKFLLVITLLTTAAVVAYAQLMAKAPEPNDTAEKAVLQATNAWLDADEHLDRSALDKIIASDFLGTAPGGRTVYKRDIMPEAGSTEGHGLAISTEEVKVRVFGDTAVVSGRGVPKIPSGNGTQSVTGESAQKSQNARPELRFTVVFVKRAERWQMVAAHLSSIASQ
jgi:ketosteroid isomerase-like protein